MAEHYGFFEANWDENEFNPITQEYTGWWDVAYLWKDFMSYFALFVSDGVFASPTDQLKVMAGQGMSVIVRPGWAFINGAWYHNETEKVLMVPYNSATSARIDSVKVRFSEADRNILALEFADDTSVTRGENTFDLKLCEILVQPGATYINAAWITDTRPDEEVCGFVKGLVDVVDSKNLFEQFEAVFQDWFSTVKDQVTGDLAIRLQHEFEQINNDLQEYYVNTNNLVNQYYENSHSLVEDYVYNDFVLPLSTLNFVNKECIIEHEKITQDALVDVYFTAETMKWAEGAKIVVDSFAGYIKLTAENTPMGEIKARIRVRVM